MTLGKNSKKRYKELRKLDADKPWSVAYSGKVPWRLSRKRQMHASLNSDYFIEMGLLSLHQLWRSDVTFS